MANNQKGILIPHNLMTIAKSQRYAQRHIGEMAGIDQSHISRWLQGKTDIKLSQALRITRTLGVAVEDIMGEYHQTPATEHEGAAS